MTQAHGIKPSRVATLLLGLEKHVLCPQANSDRGDGRVHPAALTHN